MAKALLLGLLAAQSQYSMFVFTAGNHSIRLALTTALFLLEVL